MPRAPNNQADLAPIRSACLGDEASYAFPRIASASSAFVRVTQRFKYAFVLLALLAVFPVPAHAEPAQPGAQSKPARILVRTAPAASRAQAQSLHAKAGSKSTTWSSGVVPGLDCIEVPADQLNAALAKLRADPMVLYAEPDHTRHMMAVTSSQTIPEGVSRVRAVEEWPVTRGRGVIIAHLDTGIDLTHPDLPRPLLSRSFISGVSSVQDGEGHGTHTAGILVARNNLRGVVGVAPAASLIVAKVLDDDGEGFDSAVIAGIEWAVASGARIISMSLGSTDENPALRDACAAARAAGVLLFAAAGNDGSSVPNYPAAYPSVISVSALDQSNNLASFSNFGPTIRFAAPGVNVLSTYVGGPSARWAGQDFSAEAFDGSATGTATATFVNCGFGQNAGAFPASVRGKIALIRRGGPGTQAVTFQTKAANALAAGAIGVLIANNVSGRIVGTLNSTVSIPVIGITRSQGDDLASRPGISVSICSGACHTYQSQSGTSMACPHAAGVAALLFAALPTATPAQVITSLRKTTQNLGPPGRDTRFGYGLLRADLASRFLRSHFQNSQAQALSEVSGEDATLFEYLALFFAGDDEADLNADGRIDARDLLLKIDQHLTSN